MDLKTLKEMLLYYIIMERTILKDYRVESDERYKCKYFENKIVHRNWLLRHWKSVGHGFMKSGYITDHIQNEIYNKMNERFPKIEEPEIWGLYMKAEQKAFFKDITEVDDFDYYKYEVFIQENIA